jgi:hypothetical protein
MSNDVCSNADDSVAFQYLREQVARQMAGVRNAVGSVAEPVKRWPFVETPEQFSNRLFEAIREFSSILPAVRHVLIENPPVFTHPPRREWRSFSEGALMGLYIDFDRKADKQWTNAEYLLRLMDTVQAKLKEKNHE